jgi:hypothetical protein
MFDLAPSAVGKGVGGRAVVRCRATARGRLTDCAVTAEEPAEQHFGAAAVKVASRYYVLAPEDGQGRPVAGRIVELMIRWTGLRLPERNGSPFGSMRDAQASPLH